MNMQSFNFDIICYFCQVFFVVVYVCNVICYFCERKEIECLEKLYYVYFNIFFNVNGVFFWEFYVCDGKNVIWVFNEVKGIVEGYFLVCIVMVVVDFFFYVYLQKEVRFKVR